MDGHLAAGRPTDAAKAAEELTRCAERHHNVYLSASAALARGKVRLAANTGFEDAQACLRAALQGFTHAQAPMELAHTRLGCRRSCPVCARPG